MKNQAQQEKFDDFVSVYVAAIGEKEKQMFELSEEELALVSGGEGHEAA